MLNKTGKGKYKCNIEGLSRKHCCRAKTISNTNSECVSVSLVIQHAPYYIVCSLIGSSGPSSVVGIATGYGLDGPGIESRWMRDFPHLSRPFLGPTQPPV